jgi:3-methyladenine DNA glycosylase/8-oxoguanine DNA glycosylase
MGDRPAVGTRIEIPARAPFALSAVVHSHGWAQLAPLSWDAERAELTYVAQLDSGRVVEILITDMGGGVRTQVDAPLSESERADVRRQVGWMLDVDRDLEPFYALARAEPKLAHVTEGAHGRLLRSPTLFEDVVKTILTTNTTWAGTIRMVGALVAQYGAPLPAEAQQRAPARHAFPAAAALAATDEAALRAGPRLGYRAPYVLALARDVGSGALDLERLAREDLPTTELRKRLLAIKGVGDYAAASLLMLLGRYERLPIDSWALRMVSREWHGGAPVTAREVRAAFERFDAWMGLAYWFWKWSES